MGLFSNLMGQPKTQDTRVPHATQVAGKRRPVVAGNWKMNTTYASAVALSQRISDRDKQDRMTEYIDIMLIPPFTALKGVSNVIAFDHADLILGAQDVSEHDDGAYTGQISTAMLADMQVQVCLVGHSERRVLGEDDALLARKVKKLIDAHITPILCCGEPLEVYEAEQTTDFIANQIKAGLAEVSAEEAARIIIAYEPIWAIGTGKVASPLHAQTIAKTIRDTCAELFSVDVADQIRILYGGSVKPQSAGIFCDGEDVDGVLVGGAALDADDFCRIIDEVIEYGG